jgi:hypothetical protein
MLIAAFAFDYDGTLAEDVLQKSFTEGLLRVTSPLDRAFIYTSSLRFMGE